MLRPLYQADELQLMWNTESDSEFEGDGIPFVFRIEGNSKTGGQHLTFSAGRDEAKQLADAIYKELGINTLKTNGYDGGYVEGLLRLAADHNRVVTFGYAKGKGDYIENRRLIPGQIQTTKQGHTIVVGHDPDRDDVRAYRLDKIKGQVSV